MNNERTLTPYVNIGPGYTIKKYLEARGWTQDDLAQIIDLSTKQLSLIVNNKVRITVETARLLAGAFKTSAEFWINLDTRYRLNEEGDGLKETATQRKAEVRKYMPVSEILRKGWYNFDNSAEGYEMLYKSIWDTEVSDVSMYENPDQEYCARQGKNREEFTRYYTLTWKRIAESVAKDIKVPAYDKEKLQKIADRYTTYTIQEDGIDKIVRDLYKAGVKFFILSHLSKTYLDGACFWSEENPVIVYTGRYDRVDNFWFTLAHEISHVLLHLPQKKDQCFLDDLAEGEAKDEQEKEADAQAERMLRVRDIVKLAKPYINYFSETKLMSIADTLEIELSVILGVLQHGGLVDYRKLNKYKTNVLDLFPRSVMKG